MAAPVAVAGKITQVSRQAAEPLVLLREVAAVLREAVPFDLWCGLLLDPATLVNTGGYHEEGFPLEYMPRLLEIEYGQGDVNSMADLDRVPGGVSTMERATEGEPRRSARFRDVLTPSGCGPEMRALLKDRASGAWGAFTLFRPVGEPDFADRDCQFVSQIAGDVARGLRRTMLVSEVAHRDMPDGPGMALLAMSGSRVEVEMRSEAARRWLADIPDGRLSPDGLPLMVITVAQRAVTAADGTARARVRGRAGRWITLHAETLPGRSDGGGADHRLSLVAEPTRPHELAELIAAAYGLSARERQVARMAVAGYSNREIAAALVVSPYTVSDHLKSIFAKLSVRSRAELTSRLFFDQYLPRMTDGLPLGADGWYITG